MFLRFKRYLLLLVCVKWLPIHLSFQSLYLVIIGILIAPTLALLENGRFLKHTKCISALHIMLLTTQESVDETFKNLI
jgi:hypothetical protein